MSQKLKVAIVQDRALPFAIGAGIDHALRLARQAAEGGARLIAFGETFLGGYPVWLDRVPGAMLWDHPGTRVLHALLLEQALRPADPRLVPFQKLADRADLVISIGAHERVRSSLVNTQFLFRPRAAPLLHRKLVPSNAERMIWARGDGSTLGVHAAKWGNAGHLIGWEHWMPLARAAMHHAGETVHIAAWPTVEDLHLLASSHYAFEGRCFVLAAGTIQKRADLIEGLELAGGSPAGHALLQLLPDGLLQRGGSAIIAPDAVVIARADDVPTILTGELDLMEIGLGLASLDTDGHFSRPDVFELVIDRRSREGLTEKALGGDE